MNRKYGLNVRINLKYGYVQHFCQMCDKREMIGKHQQLTIDPISTGAKTVDPISTGAKTCVYDIL